MLRFFSLIASAASLYLFSAFSTAHAQGIQEHIPESACEKGGVVANEYVFEHALRGHNVTLLQSERGNLRRFALQAVELLDAAPPPPGSEERARYNLAFASNELVNGLDNPSHGRTTAKMSNEPPAARDRITGFLSLNAPWLVITCTKTPGPAAPTSNENEEPKQTFLSQLSGIRIARDLEGAREADLGDRSYATLSGKDDREADEQSATFEGLALFPTIMKPFGNAEVETYIGYHRTVSTDADDEINDLTFGAQLSFSTRGVADSIFPAHHYFDASLDWETDDEFQSSVTALEIAYNPIWGGRFGNERRINNCLGGECVWDVTAVADLAEVGDPGDKEDLVDIEQYGRVGANLEAAYYIETAGGEISLTADYRVREALTDDGGDAERFVARLAFTPGGTGRVSFGLDYVDGEDLTSFEAEEYVAISIGFRN